MSKPSSTLSTNNARIKLLRLFERWLVFPAPHPSKADWNPVDLEFEDVYFSAEDGTRLHGWYVDHPTPRAVMLYCHGNGEDVPRLTQRLKVLNEKVGVSVFAWDYRSYGRSAGIPHEDNIVSDARVALQWLANLANVSPAEIVLMGRSLGGAVTVALAAEHPVRGLILDRTFSRLTDAAAHNFPWLPVRWIMQHRFPSIEHIRDYHGPLLQLHGAADKIVPLHQGQQLFAAAPGKDKKFIEIPDWNHNASLPDDTLPELITFLDSLSPADEATQKDD